MSNLDHIFKEEQFMKSDYSSFWNLTILGIEDEEECNIVQNEIITNYKLIHHIMNCPTCIESGLNDCKELASLKGVYS